MLIFPDTDFVVAVFTCKRCFKCQIDFQDKQEEQCGVLHRMQVLFVPKQCYS